MINITQPGSASWSYTLTNNNNIAIASGTLNSTNPINIGATAGIYTLTLTDNSGYQVIKNVQVGGQEQVIASIKASATSVQLADEVTFASTSSGAVVYNWNFGDGNTATGQSVTHNYLLEGVYTVQLTVTNTAGCVSTATRTVTVTSRDATGIQNVSNNGKINIWSNENRVYVDFSQEANVDAQVDIYNVLGQVLSSEKFGKSSIYSKEIDNLEAAYMIIRVKNNTEVTTKKVFIANVNK